MVSYLGISLSLEEVIAKRTEQFAHPDLKFLCPGALLVHYSCNISPGREKKLHFVGMPSVLWYLHTSFCFALTCPLRKAGLREV